ncbi:hypothetical protein [Mucilaginibacter sp. CSA2-8R]|uniref:hypothetical protein n=1 Tax=Mucilaginibacter sp. CSA2-8R TaxID=3141542 RepID=UPI00315D9D60
MMATLYLFFASISLTTKPCNSGFPPAANAKIRQKKSNHKDISVFTVIRSAEVKPLSFNVDNTLLIASKGVKLTAKEDSEETYTLLVSIKGKLILTKKNIRGISKVFYDNDALLFSIFTYVDEDGNNEGNGYFINLKNQSVKIFNKKLKNTCNPLVLNESIYLVDGLNIVKTDLNFKVRNNLKVEYRTHSGAERYGYLDTYLINRLSKHSDGKLIIDFSPNKASAKIKSYGGTVNKASTVILLN